MAQERKGGGGARWRQALKMLQRSNRPGAGSSTSSQIPSCRRPSQLCGRTKHIRHARGPGIPRTARRRGRYLSPALDRGRALPEFRSRRFRKSPRHPRHPAVQALSWVEALLRELVPQEEIDPLGVGLALGGAHDLPDKETEQFFFAATISCHLIRVGRQDLGNSSL